MLRIKQNKFIWFGIILLGVILIGIPAAVYAQDGPVVNPWVGRADGEVNYDADSDAISPTLGSASGDFVFTPVQPCRIIDTRNAGGKIPSFSSRSFFVHGAALTGQGGNPAGCISPVGEPRGVLINIVAVNSTGAGYLTVWPFNTAQPLAGVINYNPANKDPISNAFAVKTSYNIGYDISVYARTQTHVVADVMGYFSMPEATPLQGVTNPITNDVIPAGGAKSVFSPACPSGYTATGGGCHFTTAFNAGYTIQGTRFGGGNNWLCDFTNSTGGNAQVEVHVICRRVPGR